eukprot:INCI18962.1.p1 GENE.INCI18962.1~~INCI18962.1.p1  ORF type:complete len:582 (-),score=106.09 INCI18962.1:42-1787(-)
MQRLRSKPDATTSPRVVQRLLAARALDDSFHGDLQMRPAGPNNNDGQANNALSTSTATALTGGTHFNPLAASTILEEFNLAKHAQAYAGQAIDFQAQSTGQALRPSVQHYLNLTIDYAEEIYGCNDRDYFANFELGYSHQLKGNFLAAERHFRKAARTEKPDCWVDAVFHLATCLQRQGKVAEALKWYNKLTPSDVNSYIRNLDHEKASILMVENKLDAAIDILEVLLLQRPYDGTIVWSLTSAYYQRGTANLDSSETCLQGQYPVETADNSDVAAAVQLFWYLENVVRSHPVETGRWKGGLTSAMQKDLSFLSHQLNWRKRRAAVTVQKTVRRMLSCKFVQRLRAKKQQDNVFGVVVLRFQTIVRMKLAIRLAQRMQKYRAVRAVKIQAFIRGHQGRESLRRAMENQGVVLFFFPLDIERVDFHPKTGQPVWTRSEFMQVRHKQLQSKEQRLANEQAIRRQLEQAAGSRVGDSIVENYAPEKDVNYDGDSGDSQRVDVEKKNAGIELSSESNESNGETPDQLRRQDTKEETRGQATALATSAIAQPQSHTRDEEIDQAEKLLAAADPQAVAAAPAAGAAT